MLCHLVVGELKIRWQHLIFNLIPLYTLFGSRKRIVNLADMLGCVASLTKVIVQTAHPSENHLESGTGSTMPII